MIGAITAQGFDATHAIGAENRKREETAGTVALFGGAETAGSVADAGFSVIA